MVSSSSCGCHITFSNILTTNYCPDLLLLFVQIKPSRHPLRNVDVLHVYSYLTQLVAFRKRIDFIETNLVDDNKKDTKDLFVVVL